MEVWLFEVETWRGGEKEKDQSAGRRRAVCGFSVLRSAELKKRDPLCGGSEKNTPERGVVSRKKYWNFDFRKERPVREDQSG